MFELELTHNNTLCKKVKFKRFDECKCFDEFVMEVCEYFSIKNISSFTVKGFSLEWTVDVFTDLSTIIPQIEGVIHNLRSLKPAKLLFYEQGIERCLNFNRSENNISIFCLDLITGNKIGDEEESCIQNIEDMLLSFLSKFIEIVSFEIENIENNNLFSDFSFRVLKMKEGFI